MNRRKMWATATCCLALAGVAKAQSATAPKASLGMPTSVTDYVARGQAPNPGYPTFVPRNYVAPASPTYGGPARQPVQPAPMPVVTEADDPPATGAPPMPMPIPKSATTPMAPTTPGAGDPGASGFAADTVVPAQPATPGGTVLPGPMPASGTPFLDSTVLFGVGSMPTCWITPEYLYWKPRAVKVPALVTIAPVGAPGTLDDAGTLVAFGGQGIQDKWQTGFRVRAGIWFEDGNAGLDVGYFSLGSVKANSVFASNGDPGVFRPFFNTAINAEDAQLVSFIDPVNGPILNGAVAVQATTELSGFELNYRTGWTSGLGGRIDALVGYRYLRLNDTLAIDSVLTTQAVAGAAPIGTKIFSSDRFEGLSQFQGGQVGVAGEWQTGSMTFGLRATLGVGVTIQRVEIAGSSGSVTPAGSTVAAVGGLLALPSNMGTHDSSRFAIAPEIGATVGYQVTENVRVFGGYNLLYWTQVVRAGDQINRYVNGTYIPDPTTGTAAKIGPAYPVYDRRDTYFYAQGFTAGIEFRW